MATANDVLRIAAGEVGYSRWNDPQTGTKYGRWLAQKTGSSYFGMNGVPYCAMFVAWVLDQAGQGVPAMPTASVPSFVRGAGAIKLGNKRDARAGDVVVFDWANVSGPSDHIGFVEVNKGSYIQTIEGNTSAGSSGSQGNGGGVYRRTRDWSVVQAVYRPVYDGSAPTPTPTPSGNLEVDGYIGVASTKEWQRQLGTTVDGVISGQGKWNKDYIYRLTSVTWTGEGSMMVVKLQQFLVNRGYSVGSDGADGLMGKSTVLAIQRWMRDKCGYKKHAIDGVLGPDTAANIQNALNAGYFK